MLELDRIPPAVAVIGGGAIGCEFASMLSDLGAQVTLLEVLPDILPGCDREVADVVVKSFKKRGIVVRTGVAVHGHEPNGHGTTVLFGDGERVDVDVVVVSVGRRPLSEGLCVEGAGVEIDERGFVVVDPWMRTTADGVFAVGDVVATPQLAHVGFAEAILVVKQILGEPAVPVDYGTRPVVHLLPSRGRLRRHDRGRGTRRRFRRGRADATRSGATGGPGSSARPRGS